jgi:hypothetical protein
MRRIGRAGELKGVADVSGVRCLVVHHGQTIVVDGGATAT